MKHALFFLLFTCLSFAPYHNYGVYKTDITFSSNHLANTQRTIRHSPFKEHHTAYSCTSPNSASTISAGVSIRASHSHNARTSTRSTCVSNSVPINSATKHSTHISESPQTSCAKQPMIFGDRFVNFLTSVSECIKQTRIIAQEQKHQIQQNELVEMRDACVRDCDVPVYQNHVDCLETLTDSIIQTLDDSSIDLQMHDLMLDTNAFLVEQEYDTYMLKVPLNGTILQHTLQDQCIAVLDHVAHVESTNSAEQIHPVSKMTLDLAYAALTNNIAGKVKIASHILRACWLLGDCAREVMEVTSPGVTMLAQVGWEGGVSATKRVCAGVYKGTENLITVIKDPMQFFTNCAQACEVIARGYGEIITDGVRFEMLYDQMRNDPEHADEYLREVKDRVDAIKHSADAHAQALSRVTPGDILEEVASVIATTALMNGLGVLSGYVTKAVPQVAMAIRDGVAVSEIAITTDGVPIRIAGKAAQRADAIQAAEQSALNCMDVHKMRGKSGRACKNIISATHAKPLSKLKGKDLIGITNVSVQGYDPLPKRIYLDNYKHYLQPEIKITQKGTLKGSGWHHDPLKQIKKHKIVNGYKIEIVKERIHKSGIYEFDWSIENMLKKKSTFFPSEWSRVTVQKKIVEAFKYAKKYNIVPMQQENGNFVVHGFTKEKIKIKMVIDQNGRMITAFPLWPITP